ncbi:MAG: ATP-dependent zinc metalloprotease FtsH [bacterium]|nr:ATP-dependent zinc metalloprotease FtsH [bacterium]
MGLMLMVQMFTASPVGRVEESDLREYIKNKQVASIKLVRQTGELRGEFIDPTVVDKESGQAVKHFIADFNPEDTSLTDLMNEERVQYGYAKASPWSSLLSPQTLLLIVLFALPIVFLVWLMNRQMQSGGNNQAINFGKSRARLASDGKRRITFADVSGAEEAVEELKEVVDFLRDPKRYESLGAEIPKGVLLVGPPGCGKTHLAKAVAGEANVPFFYISGSDFVEMFVGVGASRVRDLFDQAKRRAPCLVFIDELDAVGRHRGTGIGGTHDEREQTLNQMLVEMDGFEPNSGIIVIAATNRPDVLDPALLRPGRFDRRVVVDAPDLGGRKGIMEIYARNKPMADDVDLGEVAQRTPGFTGADLKNVLNEAALLAARLGKTKVSARELFEAVDRVVAGPARKSRIISDHEKKIIAYHELGHAIVSNQLLHTDPVHKISILPRGQALGYTLQFPEQDRFLISKQQILDRISVALGGRAAEELVFGDVTTGASNDLQRSTEMVRDMITKYGMSEELGPIQFGSQHENPFLGRSMQEDRNYSEEIAFRIDQEVKRIMTDCYNRAYSALKGVREKMDYIATVLIEREHLNRSEFEQLMAGETPKEWSENKGDPDSTPPTPNAPATTATAPQKPPVWNPAPAGG